jgi:hypothetical protein
MNTSILIALLALIVAGIFAAPHIARASQRVGLITAFNVFTEGTHELSLPRRAAGAITLDWLLLKKTGTVGVVDICGAADEPEGICDDQAAAAGDQVNLILLGVSNRTLLAQTSEAIANGDQLYTAANGKVQNEPTVAGTYWHVGKAVRAADANTPVEFEPCKPTKLVVIAALTSGQNATAAATDLATAEALANALKADYNKLQADHAALAAALATPARVKILSA